MLLKLIILFCCSLFLASAQECRLVPVCDEMGISGGSISDFKGEKGSQGAAGKAGPQGLPGPSIKGDKGDHGNCTSIFSSLMAKLDEIRNQLPPVSCLSSSVFGAQQLRSGEEVFCDNGWTVFQRRLDGSISFDRPWEDYKAGFGNFRGEFWLGLETIHSLTRMKACKLRVDLWSFDDEQAFAEYRVFAVENENDNYRLHVDGYNSNSTAGDSLLTKNRFHDNMQFSTKDRDNDRSSSNCATLAGQQGGWWFNNCFRASPNSPWGRSQGTWDNIIWYTWKGHSEALKATTMKLRCDY